LKRNSNQKSKLIYKTPKLYIHGKIEKITTKKFDAPDSPGGDPGSGF
jgi:hypothetical protein